MSGVSSVRMLTMLRVGSWTSFGTDPKVVYVWGCLRFCCTCFWQNQLPPPVDDVTGLSYSSWKLMSEGTRESLHTASTHFIRPWLLACSFGLVSLYIQQIILEFCIIMQIPSASIHNSSVSTSPVRAGRCLAWLGSAQTTALYPC